MEIRKLEKSELKLLKKLCPNGKSWADVYYDKVKRSYSGNIETHAIFELDTPVAELSVVTDAVCEIETVAQAGDTIQFIDHYVDEYYRHKGYGSGLLRYLCYHYREVGYKYAVIHLHDDTALLFYKNNGFNEILDSSEGSHWLMRELWEGEG